MFSDQYEFFIDDFEKKIALLGDQQEDFHLIKGDLKNFILDLFMSIGKSINFRDMEDRLDDLYKIDIQDVIDAAQLFDEEKFYDASFVFDNGNKIILKEELNKLLESLDKIKEAEIKLGPVEILLRAEMIMDSGFQRMLTVLGDKAPIQQLTKMLLKKLAILSDNDIKILWSRIKEEFREDDFCFQYDSEILGEDFLKAQDVNELRIRIAKYVAEFRPKIVLKRLKAGQTSTPILSFGVARILCIHKHYVKDLSLNEVALIKIINRVTDFWKELFYGEKSTLYAHLGLSSEGRMASLGPLELDHDFNKTWFDFRRNRSKGYKVILLELRKLLKVINYYVTRQTNIEKALFQYKLKYEIFAKENNATFSKKKSPNELFLQKELCSFLLERDIYSYGKLFGSAEIDLMVNQPGETYVIETKIYKSTGSSGVFERRVKRDLIQLSEYLDREETSAPFGILVIYNLTDVLMLAPRQWLKKRFWILPINISKITPSQRKRSMQISESDIKNLITCDFLDSEPKK